MADGFGKYDFYASAGSNYCYRGTNLLINRLAIRDPDQLRRIETDLTAIRQQAMLSSPIKGRFSAHHLRAIHRFLFGDIYPFAGHYRREDIMKGSTRFLHHAEIPANLTKLLAELRAENVLENLDYAKMVERSAYYFAELNYIHPFREGNGRTIREFMRLLLLRNGYEVDWGRVDPDALLALMEQSVYDARVLEAPLKACLRPLDE